MNAPVRFAYANARMRAMKTELWDAKHLSRLKAAPALCVPPATDTWAELYPPLVRWYATLMAACAPAGTVLQALFRRHEIENLKLLWRCALVGQSLPAQCWRPLAPLARVEPAPARSIGGLVEQLKPTPYGHLAAETWRSHGADLVAAELALDGWVLSELYNAATSLPAREASTRDLLFSLLRERDLDILRRGREAYGLDPSFVVGLTTVLRREHRKEALRRVAAWQPSAGTLATVLPASLGRLCGDARDWDEVMASVRRVRTAECRRGLMVWPFQIAPSIAALMLREEQMREWARLAAVSRGA